MAKLYKEWVGFQWATCGLGKCEKVFGGDSMGKGSEAGQCRRLGQLHFGCSTWLEKERMKDGSSGWATQDPTAAVNQLLY